MRPHAREFQQGCSSPRVKVDCPQRFSSIKKAISYCGLGGEEKSSANTVQRTPLSKQRNKHLQTTQIEGARWRGETVRN